jgi:hypothetical protein
MINHQQDNAPRRGAQRKKITAAKPAGDPQKFPHHSERDTQSPRRQRPRIRKIFSRVLQPGEVDFLMLVWKAGVVRVADCPKLVVGLLQRNWLERDRRTLRLSEETKRLLAEAE